jgi:hypothetical protein
MIMTETKMIGLACTVMIGASLFLAALLYWLNASPLVVIFGGTLAGIAVYVTVCILSKPYITELSRSFVRSYSLISIHLI